MYNRIKKREIKRDRWSYRLLYRQLLFTNPIPFYKYLYASYTLQENISFLLIFVCNVRYGYFTLSLRLVYISFFLSWSFVSSIFVFFTRISNITNIEKCGKEKNILFISVRNISHS